MDNQTYFAPVMTIYRNDYTHFEWVEIFNACRRHYGYKAPVVGGWKFFEFETDYRTWKNQK